MEKKKITLGSVLVNLDAIITCVTLTLFPEKTVVLVGRGRYGALRLDRLYWKRICVP